MPLEGAVGNLPSPSHPALAIAAELGSLYLLEQDQRRGPAQQQQQTAQWQLRQQADLLQQAGKVARSPFGVQARQEPAASIERTLPEPSCAVSAPDFPPLQDFSHAPCSSPSQASDMTATWAGQSTPRPAATASPSKGAFDSPPLSRLPISSPLQSLEKTGSWSAQSVASPTAELASPSSSNLKSQISSQHSSPAAPLSPLPTSRLPIRSPATPIRQLPLFEAHTPSGSSFTSGYGSLGRGSPYSPDAARPADYPSPVRLGQYDACFGQPRQSRPGSLAPSPTQPSPVGWGGQAIPDSPGFKVPWFGRSRGKGPVPARGGRGSRGKGRGTAANSPSMAGRRGTRRTPGRPANTGSRSAMTTQYGGSEEPGMSVEELVALIQNLNPKQRIPDAAFHALFHFDSRAAALLLKDLSKAGSSARATELFEWLRNLETGHPLQVRQLFTAPWARWRTE